MTLYEITFRSVPRIVLACEVEVKNYRNRFDRKHEYIEISVIEEGDVLIKHDSGTEEIARVGSLISWCSDAACTVSASGDGTHRHVTVAALADYSLKSYDSPTDTAALRGRLLRGNSALVPRGLPLGRKRDEVIYAIGRIISAQNSENVSDRTRAISEWFSLMALLSDISLSELEEKHGRAAPSEQKYARDAASFIADNYNRRLSVDEVARHVGLSVGYLHRIFKRTMGCGVTEYANRKRIEVAIELMRNARLSLKDAAARVGIDDAAYMSRLFKKVTGMSATDYMKEEPLTLEHL